MIFCVGVYEVNILVSCEFNKYLVLFIEVNEFFISKHIKKL